MTDTANEQRTHAEIEAELYELVVLTKRHAGRAHKQQQQIDQGLRAIQQAQDELREAANSRHEASKAIADAKRGIQETITDQLRAQARELRQSAVMANWTTVAVAFMAGVVVGSSLIAYLPTVLAWLGWS